MCTRTPESNKDMPIEVIHALITELTSSTYLPRQIHLSGLGEPTCNTHLLPILNWIKQRGHSVGFNTNLMAISNRTLSRFVQLQLDYIYISFDAANAALFEKMRQGANFQQVVDNIHYLLKSRRAFESQAPKIILEVTVTEDNLTDIPHIITLADKMHVDTVRFNRVFRRGAKHWEDNLDPSKIWVSIPPPNIEIESRAIPINTPNRCNATTGCFITVDGLVLPCGAIMQLVPRDRFTHYAFGDLTHQRFRTIWFSKPYRDFRHRLALRQHPKICESCTFSRQI